MDPTSPLDDEEQGLAGSSASAGSDPASLEAGCTPRLDHGDTVNVIACLRRRLEAHEELAKLTDVQNRVIMQRLEEAGTWRSPRASPAHQIEEMADLLAEVVPLTERRLRAWLADCLERTRTNDRMDGMPS